MELKETAEETFDNTTSSESAVFAEFEKASKCIGLVTSESTDLKESDVALIQLRQIFDKYLELPSLLDRHVETMVGDLSKAARSIMESSDMESFYESPLPRILSALYALSKVRGRKRVQKFLPHQVNDVEVVLETLKALDKNEASNATSGDSNDGSLYIRYGIGWGF
jgi:hypothetical protein